MYKIRCFTVQSIRVVILEDTRCRRAVFFWEVGLLLIIQYRISKVWVLVHTEIKCLHVSLVAPKVARFNT